MPGWRKDPGPTQPAGRGPTGPNNEARAGENRPLRLASSCRIHTEKPTRIRAETVNRVEYFGGARQYLPTWKTAADMNPGTALGMVFRFEAALSSKQIRMSAGATEHHAAFLWCRGRSQPEERVASVAGVTREAIAAVAVPAARNRAPSTIQPAVPWAIAVAVTVAGASAVPMAKPVWLTPW
jgi:hypothetical protein